MNNRQLAAAYGLSPNTTKKWSIPKRQQAIADLNHGIDPIIAGLVAECAMEAYKASRRLGVNVSFQPFFGEGDDAVGLLDCFYFTDLMGKNCKDHRLASALPLTVENLTEVLNGLRTLEKL